MSFSIYNIYRVLFVNLVLLCTSLPVSDYNVHVCAAILPGVLQLVLGLYVCVWIIKYIVGPNIDGLFYTGVPTCYVHMGLSVAVP